MRAVDLVTSLEIPDSWDFWFLVWSIWKAICLTRINKTTLRCTSIDVNNGMNRKSINVNTLTSMHARVHYVILRHGYIWLNLSAASNKYLYKNSLSLEIKATGITSADIHLMQVSPYYVRARLFSRRTPAARSTWITINSRKLRRRVWADRSVRARYLAITIVAAHISVSTSLLVTSDNLKLHAPNPGKYPTIE